jgi:hypothetical protein
VKLDDFREDDEAGGGEEEGFVTPEVTGGFSLGADDAQLVLEVIAGLKAADGNLLFFEIAVEGSFAGDLGGQLLGVGGRGGDEGAVGVVDADVVDFYVFGGGGEGKGDDTEIFDGGLVANLDDAGDVAGAGAVGGVTIDASDVVEDDGLATVVGGGGGGRGGEGFWACADFGARGRQGARRIATKGTVALIFMMLAV